MVPWMCFQLWSPWAPLRLSSLLILSESIGYWLVGKQLSKYWKHAVASPDLLWYVILNFEMFDITYSPFKMNPGSCDFWRQPVLFCGGLVTTQKRWYMFTTTPAIVGTALILTFTCNFKMERTWQITLQTIEKNRRFLCFLISKKKQKGFDLQLTKCFLAPSWWFDHDNAY